MRPIARISAAVLIALHGAVALAEEGWTLLDGPGIQTALTGVTLDYPGAWQDFRETGRTLYNAGVDSWGYWQVQDDRYCSQWPPNAFWACYDVHQRGNEIRFTGAHDDVSIGVIQEAP
ncbi:MAG: hypothetical protein AAF891_08845 [Pseudomonadota bacterium]